jgi:hypothetical protein
MLDLVEEVKSLQLEVKSVKEMLKRSSTTGNLSSGLKSPDSQSSSKVTSGMHTPSKYSRKASNSEYYFKKLKNHFDAKNSGDRYAIILTKYVCVIFDGSTTIHSVSVDANDSTSIRNLYLIFFACNYDVEIFKNRRSEFAEFEGIGQPSPPEFNERSNVFVLDK